MLSFLSIFFLIIFAFSEGLLSGPALSALSAPLELLDGNNKADLNVTGAHPNQTETVSWEGDAAGRLAEGPDRASTS